MFKWKPTLLLTVAASLFVYVPVCCLACITGSTNHMIFTYALTSFLKAVIKEPGISMCMRSANERRHYNVTHLMLETEYSGFGGQYHSCLCLGSYSHQSISRHGIACVGQTTCIVVPELISSTWVKPNSQITIHNVNTCLYFVTFKTIQHIKS